MKKMWAIGVVSALFAMVWFAGSALGAGIEGGAETDDCLCITQNGQPDVTIKGPYQKGTFTISNGPNNSAGSTSNIFISHLFLRWGNRIFLSPVISDTTGAATICALLDNDDQLAILIKDSAAVCYLGAEEAFGLEGTPVVKEVIITDKAGCDTPSISDDIVRGEITVGVVPTSLIYDGASCVEPPSE
jgi:hypothetical protein